MKSSISKTFLVLLASVMTTTSFAGNSVNLVGKTFCANFIDWSKVKHGEPVKLEEECMWLVSENKLFYLKNASNIELQYSIEDDGLLISTDLSSVPLEIDDVFTIEDTSLVGGTTGSYELKNDTQLLDQSFCRFSGIIKGSHGGSVSATESCLVFDDTGTVTLPSAMNSTPKLYTIYKDKILVDTVDAITVIEMPKEDVVIYNGSEFFKK